MKKVNIICMKWGSKFPASYVNKLYAMVSRNLTIDFRFVCFTENSDDIIDAVEIQSLPKLALPDNIPERGWRKLTVFKDNFGNLIGQTLFLDLDIVIVDNIDKFFTKTGDFLIVHDKKNPKKREGNSSVFRFEIGKFTSILQYFENNFEKVKNEVRHEQAYLSREINKLGKLEFWSDDWVPSFKYKCCHNLLLSPFFIPKIPKNAKIIIFHGLPNPLEAITGNSGKWYRILRPALWIKKYWYE